MSKQIAAHELAEVVRRLLTDPESAGELESFGAFQSFMTDIADVVCKHCGGEVRLPANPLEDVWYVGIHGNDSLPDSAGGIWREFDVEGALFPNGPKEWFVERYGHEHPDFTRARWQNCSPAVEYWTWVSNEANSAGIPAGDHIEHFYGPSRPNNPPRSEKSGGVFCVPTRRSACPVVTVLSA
jgi:hypothetical protein